MFFFGIFTRNQGVQVRQDEGRDDNHDKPEQKLRLCAHEFIQSGDITGILNPATKPIHVLPESERGKVPMLKEFMVDLCLPAAQVRELVRPGDPIVLEQTTVEIGDCVSGQAMDNRISQWVSLNAIKKAKGKNIYDISWVGATQEEVGLRGAQVAAQNVPGEIGIAIDVTPASSAAALRR